MIGRHPIFVIPLGMDKSECGVCVGNEVWGLKTNVASGFMFGHCWEEVSGGFLKIPLRGCCKQHSVLP